VEHVGPEHFGVVTIDCAKHRSKWMLCDFYGKVLAPPTELPHSQGHFDMAICQLRESLAKHALRDVVVAIERTGDYHLPIKRAFADAGFESRIVHPFATKQFRQPANPGIKTDDNDLAAIFRATINGFGLLEPPCDSTAKQLRLLVRHRRDLVQKRSAVCCQLHEHWQNTLPGFAACFVDLWTAPAALCVARHFASPQAVLEAQTVGLAAVVRQAGHPCHSRSIERILAWSQTAPKPDPEFLMHHQIAATLDDDRLAKTRQIAALEQQLVGLLVQTPYVLLLSIPGVNVVSAAEFAAEMGPITHYANAKAITGRAGLFPARYQSDQVDLKDGALVRCANRSLRAAIMMVADNLIKCNAYFKAKAEVWTALKRDARHVRVQVASRFCRIAYLMVAGGQVFRHPCCQKRDYVLDKLLTFHGDHQIPSVETLHNLQLAVGQLPAGEHAFEAVPLTTAWLTARAKNHRGPQPIGDVLLAVLAKLGASPLQSNASGD
jgi:transposase